LDQFEQARLRNEKRLERMARTQANQAQPEEKVVFIEPQQEKEEPVTGAIIEVKLTLPSGEVSFTFVKPGVKPTITARDIKRAIEDGLRPVLGGVKEL
jgi:uncharacterized protein YndB with AHSA1/START domain